jgi:hypothetical protein
MTAVTLVRLRMAEAAPNVRTYVAIRSAVAVAFLAEIFGSADTATPPVDAETLPWDTLPGIRELAAADLGPRPPGMVALLGTTVRNKWAEWHLPVPPPPVPSTEPARNH